MPILLPQLVPVQQPLFPQSRGLVAGHSQAQVLVLSTLGAVQVFGHSHTHVLGLSTFEPLQVIAGHSHWHVVGLKTVFGALHAARQVLLLWQKLGKLLVHWNPQVLLAVQTNVPPVGTSAFGQHTCPHLVNPALHVKPQTSWPSAVCSHWSEPPSGTSAFRQHISPHLVNPVSHVKPQVPLAVQVNVPPSGTSACGQHSSPHLWNADPQVKPQMSCPVTGSVSHWSEPPSGTSAFRQHISPHLVKPWLQVKSQVPLVQVNVALPGTFAFGQHCWPHLVKPLLHAKSQAPLVHTGCAFAGAVKHLLPQPPQLFKSVWRLVQKPVGLVGEEHVVWPAGQPPHMLLARQVWPVAQQRLPQARDFGQQALFPDWPMQVRP